MIIEYLAAQSCHVLFCPALPCTVICCPVLYFSVLHCPKSIRRYTMRYIANSLQYNTSNLGLHHTRLHYDITDQVCTVLYCPVLTYTVKPIPVQCCIVHTAMLCDNYIAL